MGIVRSDYPYTVDEDLNTRIDTTTNVLYIYVWENLRPDAVAADTDWRLSRITLATGTLMWAEGNAYFNKQASLAPTTYTFTD